MGSVIGKSVGRSVCHNFQSGREVTLPCSYRGTCFKTQTLCVWLCVFMVYACVCVRVLVFVCMCVCVCVNAFVGCLGTQKGRPSTKGFNYKDRYQFMRGYTSSFFNSLVGKL